MSTIFILASLGLIFGYANPTYRGVTGSSDIQQKSVKELLDEKSQYEAALEKTREIEEVRNGLHARYNQITDIDRGRLSKMIPNDIDSVRLIIDVNNIAAAYGMSLREISIADAPAGVARKDNPVSISQSGAYSYVDLSFSVTGIYANLIAFLSDLEKSLRISDIINLNIGGASTAPTSGPDLKNKPIKSEPRYKIKVTLRTYFLTSK